MQTPRLLSDSLPIDRRRERQFTISKIDKTGIERIEIEPCVSPGLRVLVTDRDSMSSDLLAIALTKHGMCDAHAVSAVELLDSLETPTDLVVIGSDVKFGNQNAYDLAHDVNQRHPNVLIVMILNQADHDSVINSFRAGARGVYSREQPMTFFLDCVKHVHKGFIWAGGREASYLLEVFRSLPAPAPVTNINSPSLTDRELQVVRLVAKGKTNRAIANALNLSEHTVKNYLFRAFEKLGVSTRVELLFYLTVRGHSFAPNEQESL